MTVYLAKEDGAIILNIRAEGGGAIGDARIGVEPGMTILGRTYEEWAALPEGPHRVPESSPWKPLKPAE